MAYIQECLEKFQELPTDIKKNIGGPLSFNNLKELEKKYKVSLSFLLVLLSIGELEEEDIADYLAAKNKIDLDRAKLISEEFEEKIWSPILEKIIEAETPLNVRQSEELIIKVFSEKLLDTLRVSNNNDLKKLNILIFDFFQKNELFEDKVTNLLYNSQELISKNKININGQEVKPTVSNWLKDFIADNGSEMFSNVVLVKYLADGKNVKTLNEEDRTLVKKLLKLYRNLVFFPDSMENIPLEEWEIFPIDQTQVSTGTALKKKGKMVDVLDDNSQDLVIFEPVKSEEVSKSKAEAIISDSGPAAVLAPKEPSELDQLEELLKKYPVGSFEYKTIQQEIKRLKRLGQK